MSHQPLIECRSVRKAYRTALRKPGFRGLVSHFVAREWREFVALDDVSLEIGRGEFVGLIGANGAGKTTLVKCLTGIVPVSSGAARLFAQPCFELTDSHKRRLSLVMGQRSQLWWDIPAVDSFRLLKEIYRVDPAVFERRVSEFAERLGVTHCLRAQLRRLSLGERIKMEIIGAFLHDPDVVFLDEPTIGLDLVSQETIRAFLRELNERRGVTVVLTSHDMADIEQTCERLLILERGRVLFDGDLTDLQQQLVGRRAIEVQLEPDSRPWGEEGEALLARHGARRVASSPRTLTFVVEAGRSQAFVRALFGVVDVRDLSIERQPLEDLVRQVFRSGGFEP